MDEPTTTLTSEDHTKGSGESTEESPLFQPRLRLGVDWLDYEHFKNRYSETEEIGVLEVLVGNENLERDIILEAARRFRYGEQEANNLDQEVIRSKRVRPPFNQDEARPPSPAQDHPRRHRHPDEPHDTSYWDRNPVQHNLHQEIRAGDILTAFKHGQEYILYNGAWLKFPKDRNGVPIPKPRPNLESLVDGRKCWIERVRLNSRPIIALLARLTGHGKDWDEQQSRVVFRPFRAFYYYRWQLKECLDLLEKADAAGEMPKDFSAPTPLEQVKLPAMSGPTAAGVMAKRHIQSAGKQRIHGEGDGDGNSDKDPPLPMTPEAAISTVNLDVPTAIDHLRLLISFVDQYVVPDWQRAAGTSQRMFRCPDLWMAFQPNELLYVPQVGPQSPLRMSIEQTATPKSIRHHSIWRLYTMEMDPTPGRQADERREGPLPCLQLDAYRFDHDGTSYIPVRWSFAIEWYSGEVDITTLGVFPLRFLKDAKSITARLHQQGQLFQKAIKDKYHFYKGWVVTDLYRLDFRDPSEGRSFHGRPERPRFQRDPRQTDIDMHARRERLRGEEPLSTQHLESEVIIDLVEGYGSQSGAIMGPWYWSVGLPTVPDDRPWLFTPDMDLLVWADLGVPSRWRGAPPIIFKKYGLTDSGMTLERYSETFKAQHLETRPALKAYDEQRTPIKDLVDDDLVLLPGRVIGYPFRLRRFVILDVNSLLDIPKPEDVWKDLCIDRLHKKLVKSLVKSHLAKHNLRKCHPEAHQDQDIIRGKGNSLVFLLHGPPGVGKTATAEAVARANKKPLFPITCGDLGFTPDNVERALNDIFRLANIWDCILLLDEADIFLSRRELNQMERNALVSVFLRVLEYYNGILFLTTNRVGTLDEAFKSRIHISLYYPPLTRDQTVEIFKTNIRKLKEIIQEKEKLEANPAAGEPGGRFLIHKQSIVEFAKTHFDKNKDTPHLRWNGREIRNAFQIASAMAEVGKPNPHTGNRVLHAKHFKRVEEANKKFEVYLYETTEATDSERARKARLRRDDWDPNANDERDWQEPGRGLPFRGGPPGAYGHGYGYGYGVAPLRPGLSPYRSTKEDQRAYEATRPAYGYAASGDPMASIGQYGAAGRRAGLSKPTPGQPATPQSFQSQRASKSPVPSPAPTALAQRGKLQPPLQTTGRGPSRSPSPAAASGPASMKPARSKPSAELKQTQAISERLVVGKKATVRAKGAVSPSPSRSKLTARQADVYQQRRWEEDWEASRLEREAQMEEDEDDFGEEEDDGELPVDDDGEQYDYYDEGIRKDSESEDEEGFAKTDDEPSDDEELSEDSDDD